jgi:hypothetical protein
MQLVRTAPRHQNNQRINGIRAVQRPEREREVNENGPSLAK